MSGLSSPEKAKLNDSSFDSDVQFVDIPYVDQIDDEKTERVLSFTKELLINMTAELVPGKRKR